MTIEQQASGTAAGDPAGVAATRGLVLGVRGVWVSPLAKKLVLEKIAAGVHPADAVHDVGGVMSPQYAVALARRAGLLPAARSRPRLSRCARDMLIQLVRSGRTVPEAIEAIGEPCHANTAYRLLRAAGIQRRRSVSGINSVGGGAAGAGGVDLVSGQQPAGAPGERQRVGAPRPGAPRRCRRSADPSPLPSMPPEVFAFLSGGRQPQRRRLPWESTP